MAVNQGSVADLNVYAPSNKSSEHTKQKSNRTSLRNKETHTYSQRLTQRLPAQQIKQIENQQA